jgi:hypothetical protein
MGRPLLIPAIAYWIQEKALVGLKPFTRRLLASGAGAITAHRPMHVAHERKIILCLELIQLLVPFLLRCGASSNSVDGLPASAAPLGNMRTRPGRRLGALPAHIS